MEAIITVVGFLGAGKTTLLKHLMNSYIDKGWNPFIVLNDYENANMDAQQFAKKIEIKNIKPLSGSCICCSGIVELDACLLTENEIKIWKNQSFPNQDQWPIAV